MEHNTHQLTQIAAGNHQAFEDFYRAHLREVMAGAAARCRQPHEVAEVAAAVFIAVWHKAHTFDHTRGNTSQWLAGITSRAVIDLHRSSGRFASLRDRIATSDLLAADNHDRLADQIDAARAADVVLAALDDLPVAQREAFRLVVLHDMSATDAATALGSNPARVRKQVSRAKQQIRALTSEQVRPLLSTNTYGETR